MTTPATVTRVAVIGTGHWGRNIVRNMHGLGALAAMHDDSPATRQHFAAEYPDTPVRDSIDEVLGDPAIDGVMIATPAVTHGRLVDAALDAGKHVFVEKPLCLDPAEAAGLAEKARARGLVLMVGHLLLYHPAFVALATAVREGALGTLRYIYSNRLSLGRIRREENALWSFAPHDISMILSLAGGPPERVTASGGYYLSKDIADTTMSILKWANGLQAHIFVSWLHPYKDQRLVVIGEKAMAVFNDVAPAPEKLLLYRHEARWDGAVPVIAKADAEPLAFAGGEPLRLECEAFLSAIRTGTPPPSDAAEGIGVLAVLDACQRAIASGRETFLATP